MERILVTGGSGLVGTALSKILPDAIYVSSSDYDLTSEKDVVDMFEEIKPQRIVHLAARVGGIIDNTEHPVVFFDKNVLINTLMIKYSYIYGASRFLGVLSSCIFPDDAPVYPLKEEHLHQGAPPVTNFSYATAKRAMAVQIDAYNKEYGTKYNYIIPCNLFGEEDKDNYSDSHFVAALIKKIYIANKEGVDRIELYGDGTPLRQFMYVHDLARIIKLIIYRDITDCFNIAPPWNMTIDEIARTALKATNSEHLDIFYNISYPNGQMRKDIDTSIMSSLFPDFEFTPLEKGLSLYYQYYLHD